MKIAIVTETFLPSTDGVVTRIRAALEEMRDICLVLVGDGPERRYLEKYFAGTNTVYTGFLHGEELRQVLRRKKVQGAYRFASVDNEDSHG